MRRAVFSLICGLGLLLAASGTRADPVASTDESESTNLRDQVYFTWQLMRFEELEAWATAYRTTTPRTKSGHFDWLPVFYTGFTHLNDPKRDPDFARKLRQSWDVVLPEWLSRYPRSPTPHVAHASLLMHLAWNARGGGYSNTVWKQDGQKFKEQLKELRLYLQRHKAVAESDPVWHQLDIEAEFLLSPTGHANLTRRLREASARFPEQHQFYHLGARLLLPKWGGNADIYHRFVEQAVRSTESKEGTALGFRLYYASGHELTNYSDLRDPSVWQSMQVAMQATHVRYPHLSNTKRFLLLACKARDADEVRRLWSVLAEQAGKPWDRDIDPPSYCRWNETAVPRR